MRQHRWNTQKQEHRIMAPRNIQEIQKTIKNAGEHQQTITVFDTGYDSKNITESETRILSLNQLSGLTAINPQRQQATFLAGTTLSQASKILAEHGFTFTNMGRTGEQTLAEAISTGMHGTGNTYGIFATQLQELTLITAQGDILTCSPHKNNDIFTAAQLGLGALGIIFSLTFRIEPLFRLHAAERKRAYEDIIHHFAERSSNADHYEITWFIGSSQVRTRRLTRLPLLTDGYMNPSAVLSKARRHLGDNTLNNGAFHLMSYLGYKQPATKAALNNISSWGKGNRRYADLAPQVYTQKRTVRRHTMEYAFEVHQLASIMEDIRAAYRDSKEHLSYPLLVRTAAADNIALSPAYQQDTVFICAREYWKTPPQQAFNTLETIFKAYGGRVHWGHYHTNSAEELQGLYPRFEWFCTLRKELDPQGIFLNAQLRRLLT
ncbi:D-arabinono-1,4-lactone oxidase [Rothia sp. P7208]|uniref:D-arabinono-1,4-lactone oxidase n=1 Tax=Rothia sp. P7208 TaxID=3402660 RepID=UPI003ABF0FC8